MAVLRAIGTMLIAATLTAGCTSSGNGNTKSSTGPSGTPSGPSGTSTGPAATCTKASAITARQTLITKSGFNPSCVKITTRSTFLFINNDSKKAVHTAITAKSAPEQLNVQLPHKNSTFAHSFKKRGTYVFSDTASAKKMTLFVS